MKKFLIGLAAVLGIVRGHRGAIIVRSEPDQGTCIRVLFPPCAHSPQSLQPVPTNGRHKPDEWRGEGVVLVVDDEQVVRDVTCRMLKHAGFTPLTAKDGGEGVELFKLHANDIVAVLLDLTMPKLDGEQTLRQIRGIRPDVRVILTSGFPEESAATRFAGLGLAGFIQKPYQATALIGKFREVLENRN
jgi:CheY-like chemotaxis protein